MVAGRVGWLRAKEGGDAVVAGKSWGSTEAEACGGGAAR